MQRLICLCERAFSGHPSQNDGQWDCDNYGGVPGYVWEIPYAYEKSRKSALEMKLTW
jgi:hypothetical protein